MIDKKLHLELKKEHESLKETFIQTCYSLNTWINTLEYLLKEKEIINEKKIKEKIIEVDNNFSKIIKVVCDQFKIDSPLIQPLIDSRIKNNYFNEK